MPDTPDRARPLLGFSHILMDMGVMWLNLFVIVSLYRPGWHGLWNTYLIGAFLVYGVVFSLQSYYLKARYQPFNISVFRLYMAWALVCMGILSIGFMTKTSETYSRFIVGAWMLSTPILLTFSLMIIRAQKRKYDAMDAQNRRSIVIGTDRHAYDLYQRLVQFQKAETCLGVVVAGKDALKKVEGVRILGNVNHVRGIVTGSQVKKVYIALGLKYSEKVQDIQHALLDLNVDVCWAPDIQNFNLINHSITSFAGLPVIAINQSPLTASDTAALAKSLLDRSLALIAILLASPIMIPVAILVKLSSPGPVLFKQPRTGFDGEIIEVWKFRSMKMHREKEGCVTQARKDDDRITPIGGFIRKTSIDELPQLFNVLQGSMSMVGPRPHAIAHNEIYSKKINAYLARHRMKPGITGWAQVHGFRGETDTDDKMEMRVKYDLEYINNWSIWLDIRILAMTPFSLFRHEAY